MVKTQRTAEELKAGVSLEAGKVHKVILVSPSLTVVVHPLDLLHFDDREPRYQESIAQRADVLPPPQEPVFVIRLFGSVSYDRTCTVDERPTDKKTPIKFEFPDLSPREKYTLTLQLRGEQEITLFQEKAATDLHDFFNPFS